MNLRSVTYKEKSLIAPLYEAIVIPHLEYGIQAWRTYPRKDLRYEERLKERGLTTLETRRIKGGSNRRY